MAVSIPEGYTALDYIESGNGQYLLLYEIFSTEKKWKIEMDIELLGNGEITGTLYTNSSGITTRYELGRDATGRIFATIGSRVYTVAENVSLSRHIITIDKKNGTTSVDGISKNYGVSDFGEVSLQVPLLACLDKRSASAVIWGTPIHAKLYSVKIYDNDVLKSHLLPYRTAAGEAGMYDTMLGYTFLSKSGTPFNSNIVAYRISASASPAAGRSVSGGGSYGHGESVSLRATPNSGYRFLQWTEAGTIVSTNETYSFTAISDRSLTAVFEQIPRYTVTVNASPVNGGTVSGGGIYETGSNIQLGASANDGFRFLRWEKDGNTAAITEIYPLTVKSDSTFTAVFEQIPIYQITLSAEPADGGTVSGGGTYQEGSSVTVSATANSGYHFQRWTEDGNTVSTSGGYSFSVRKNRNLIAVFEEEETEPQQYRVTVLAAPDSGGTVSGGGVFPEGTAVTVQAVPKEGYAFNGWTEDGTAVSENPKYTFLLNRERTLTAQFQAVQRPPETTEELSGLQRRELYVDARDLQSDSDPEHPLTAEEYRALLLARGREKLAENQLVRSFHAEIRTIDPTYLYGVDFFLGDTITVTDERLGVTVDAVVQGAERSVSEAGEKLTLTLGYEEPTIYRLLRRKAGK